MGMLAAVALGAYGWLRRSSPALVAYVVRETLVQKAPEGTDPPEIRRLFALWLNAPSSETGRVDRLFELSRQLERVQRLSDAELNRLLKPDSGLPPSR